MNNCPSSSDDAKVECVTCERCKSTCPTKVDLPEVMRLKRYLDRPRGSHRDLFILTQKMLARSEAAPWLPPELDTGRDDVYYFPGCLPVLDELIDGHTAFKRAASAGVALLNHLGISPKIIYGCCGHDLYYSGNLEHFDLIHERLSSIQGKVITGCAECYHSLRELHGLEAVHISQLLAERLGPVDSTRKASKVTYHDPCRLGRHHGVYEAPRQVLSSLADLREMPDSREESLCCGVSAWMNCNPASKISRIKRLEQASEVEAEFLVTSCSKCRTHLGCVYREEAYSGEPKEVEIVDLQEFVADAIGIEVPEIPALKPAKGRRLMPIHEMMDLDGRVSSKDLDNIFACTTCERCEVECEYSYQAVQDVESLRKDVALRGMGPEQHRAIAAKVKATGNVFGEEGAFSRPREGAEYIYFPGCVAQFRRPSLLKDTLLVLDSLGLSYEVPEGLVCCGSVLKRTGHDLDEVRATNSRILGGRKIVTSCAGCYSTLARDYPGLDVVHVSQLLCDRMSELKLGPLDLDVAYHDPCHLGRRMQVYEEPRRALSSIPGLRVKEFRSSRERATCCGGGGGVRSARKDLASKLAMEKVIEAEELDVDAIATSCPFCEVNLEEGAEVMDVVELVARSLREGVRE